MTDHEPRNDAAPRPTVRLAIAGVGNCASSLVQGLQFYRDADPTESVPGLMHVDLGGYHVGDVEVVAAFDVDANKVGADVGKAIFAAPNNTIRFAEVPDLGVTVQRGPTLDGFGDLLPRGVRGVAEHRRSTWPTRCASAGGRAGLLPARRIEAGAEALRRGLPRRRRRLRQRHPRVHRLRTRSGPPASRPPACRSSATTSSRRSAPRSCTAS